MFFEVEQKFLVVNMPDLEQKVAAIGGVLSASVEQVDRYFAHPGRDFGQTDEALRVRSVGDRNFITYKGPRVDRTTKTRREIEIPVANGPAAAAELRELLTLLGFEAVADVCKTRQTASIVRADWQVEIALDTVDQLGSFSELEIVCREDRLDDAKRTIRGVAQELGLAASETRSYLELWLARNDPGR